MVISLCGSGDGKLIFFCATVCVNRNIMEINAVAKGTLIYGNSGQFMRSEFFS